MTTSRKTLDQLNSDELDQLYADRDQARQRAADAYGQRDRLRLRVAALAERWRLPGHISMPEAAAEIVEALDREQWAPCPDPIARVRAAVHIADAEDVTDWQRGYRACSVNALTALDQAAPAPAATEGTEPPNLRTQLRTTLARFIDPDNDCMPTLSTDGNGFTWIPAGEILDQLAHVLDTGADQVRALHRQNENTGECEYCSARDYPDYAVPYPCDTVRALDGEQQP